MTWKRMNILPLFFTLSACCLVLSSVVSAQTTVPVVGKNAEASWSPPAGTPAGTTWIDVTGAPETLAGIELVITTPLTDMNSVIGGQPPPVFRSPRLAYSATNKQAIGEFLKQIQGATGVYLAWLRVFDQAGNESLWAKSNEFSFDLASPAPASGLQVKVTVTVEVITGGGN